MTNAALGINFITTLLRYTKCQLFLCTDTNKTAGDFVKLLTVIYHMTYKATAPGLQHIEIILILGHFTPMLNYFERITVGGNEDPMVIIIVFSNYINVFIIIVINILSSSFYVCEPRLG